MAIERTKLVDEFLSEFKVMMGYDIVDDDLTDDNYLVILGKTVRELGAYATEIRKDTVLVSSGVADLSEMNVNIVIAVYNTPSSASEVDNSYVFDGFSPGIHSNIESLSGTMISSNLTDQRVALYSLGMLSSSSDRIEYRFDNVRQVLLIPSISNGSITVEYMKKISSVDYLISDPYWNTRLYDLFKYNVMITLGTIYKKVTVNSSPYNLNTDMLSEGQQLKEEFMERLRETLWTFHPM